MEISPEVLRRSVESLLRLQQIDGQVFHLKLEEKTPSSEYLVIEEQLVNAQKIYKTTDRSFREVERERRSLELRALTLQEDLKRAENKKREVRNTKEEFAANKELESVQKRLLEAKKQLEESRISAEARLNASDEHKKVTENMNEHFKKIQEARNARLAEVKIELEKLEATRAQYISQVDEQVFSLYERVQKLRKGSGVAIVAGFICTACHVSIPPAVRYQLDKMEKIITCPSCSRILFPDTEAASLQVAAVAKS